MAGKGFINLQTIPTNPASYYVGLLPADFTDTNICFVDPNFTYNPATGTLQVSKIKYRTAGTTDTGLPKSVGTYVDIAYSQAVVQGQLTDVVPFSVTLTPSSINSRIAIFVNWFGEHQTTSGWDAVYGLKRNGSPIGLPVNTSNRTGGMAMAANSYYTGTANDDSTPEALSFHYIDYPNTLEPVTYQLTVISGTAALTVYTNRTVGDINQATDYERGTSSIIAIEVAL